MIASIPAGASAATPPLPAITIHLSDLRPGYTVAESRYRTPASIATQDPLLKGLLISHGWLGGYDARYDRSTNSRVQIGVLADRFGGTAGAHWWIGASILRVPTGYRAIQMASVGDESISIENAAYVAIIFRRGTVVIDVYVSLQAPLPVPSVLHLARVMDTRLVRGPGAAISPASQSIPRQDNHSRTVRVWVRQHAMPSGTEVTLYVEASTGARCVSLVTAQRRASIPFRGFPWIVGKAGVVAWQWLSSPTATRDIATVTCTYRGRTDIARRAFTLKHVP